MESRYRRIHLVKGFLDEVPLSVPVVQIPQQYERVPVRSALEHIPIERRGCRMVRIYLPTEF